MSQTRPKPALALLQLSRRGANAPDSVIPYIEANAPDPKPRRAGAGPGDTRPEHPGNAEPPTPPARNQTEPDPQRRYTGMPHHL